MSGGGKLGWKLTTDIMTGFVKKEITYGERLSGEI